MAETLTIRGSVVAGSAVPFPIALDEALSLKRKHYDEVDLTSDSATPLNFGGITNAHVVVLVATRKTRARVTSADGATQIVPFTLLVLRCDDVPITAIDLTRVPGTSTQVKALLVEKN
jgi:hypothetical protein